MNNSNTINKEKKKKKYEGVDGREQFRVVITVEANKAIEEIAIKVNEGFEAGAVSKSDIANYIFLNLSKSISDGDIKNLRTIHFDDKKVLSTLLRDESELPDDLKKAVRAYYGISDKEKKRPPKEQIKAHEEVNIIDLNDSENPSKTRV